jgi:hypothetical protein
MCGSLSGTISDSDDLITIDDDAGIFTVQDPWCILSLSV